MRGNRLRDRLDRAAHAANTVLNVVIEIDSAARQWLARNGYEPSMGARPMARLIQDKIKKPLANELLFGELTQGGTVKIGARDDDLVLTFVAHAAKVEH